MKKRIFIFGGSFSQWLFGAYICTGELDDLRVAYTGVVIIMSQVMYGDNAGRAICSVATDYKDVPIETCNAWLGILLSASASNISVRLQYRDGFSCDAQPLWGDASRPHWIGIE